MSKELVEKARAAAQLAHCPYSKFHVGAALKTKSGETILGCNIENASYGLAICAERVAIFKAVSEGKTISELAVSCADAIGDPDKNSKMPCGACRQVMAEFMPMDAQIHVDGVGSFHLKDLLPHGFVLPQKSRE